MLPPVTIPELDPAGPVNYDNDLLLIRQGLNDKKISAGNLVKVQLETYSSLARPIIATDVILVGANNGDGTYTNYTADPRALGFLVGVTTWFFADDGTAPLNWTSVAGLGDRVLAVKGGAGAYANVGINGTWQQENTSLVIQQIPSHSHYMDVGFLWPGPGAGNPSSTKVGGAANGTAHKGYVPSFPTGGNGSTRKTSSGDNDAPNDNLPNADGHNHGATWRPAAAIGVVCQKTG